MQDTKKTKVIFRYWKDNSCPGNEVIAIFPELAGNSDPSICQSYQHIGQHGACNPYHIIDNSRLATEAEYTILKRELECHYGYNLKVVKKHRYSHFVIRKLQLN